MVPELWGRCVSVKYYWRQFGSLFRAMCLVSTLSALTSTASVAAERPARNFTSYVGYELVGGDYAVSSPGTQMDLTACRSACKTQKICKAYTFIQNTSTCRLKKIVSQLKRSRTAVSGVLTELRQPTHLKVAKKLKPRSKPKSRSLNYLWLHRGSKLSLVKNGAKRQMVYRTLNADSKLRGAKIDGFRFKGRKNGRSYHGSAYFHGGKCGTRTYRVKGTISRKYDRLKLTGKAPAFDSKCREVKGKSVTLIFNRLASTGRYSDIRSVKAISSSSAWRHNGSLMKLIKAGSGRQFIYHKPSKQAARLGAKPGRLRFKGLKKGNTYSGRVYQYNKKCGRNNYRVKGRLAAGGRRIKLQGKAPVRNKKCKIVSRHVVVLVFSLK